MKVAIAGGTGFVGKAITDRLLAENHEVLILTRNKNGKQEKENLHFIEWLKEGTSPEKELENCDIFINLAGESINNGRWTKKQKRRILQSRLHATSEIIRIMKSMKKMPDVLINASAIGYYGISDTEVFTEDSPDVGYDFLAHTVQQWEKEASKAQQLGVRTVFLRFGIILGKEGGALPRLIIPYKFFAGGTVGSGKQWMSWVHIEDVVRAVVFAIHNSAIAGAVNITSPNPVRMEELGRAIAKIMQKPHWLPVPSPLLKLALGEMSILVLEGQKVLPQKLINHAYSFTYPHIKEADRKSVV